MEERKNIIQFQNTLQLPKDSVRSMVEWEGKLVSAHGDGGVYITTESESKQLWKEHCFAVTIWNGNLACGGCDVISIWNSDEKCIMEVKGNTDSIWCLVEWNEYLVSGSGDKTIQIWDRNGKCQITMNQHSGTVRCLVVWKDNLVSGSNDKTIMIWNIKGDCLMKLTEHTDRIHSLAVYNDNLVSGSDDKTIQIWSKDGKCIQVLKGHTEGILTLLEWNEYLISADFDENVRVWNERGHCLHEMKAGRALAVWNSKLACGSASAKNIQVYQLVSQWKSGIFMSKTLKFRCTLFISKKISIGSEDFDDNCIKRYNHPQSHSKGHPISHFSILVSIFLSLYCQLGRIVK